MLRLARLQLGKRSFLVANAAADELHRKKVITVAAIGYYWLNNAPITIENRAANREVDYEPIVEKINRLM